MPRAQRWAIEFRASWLSEPIFALLAKHRVALCVHDMIPEHPRHVTADFIYLRFHGRRYGGCYAAQQLAAQARRVQGHLADRLDVYAYFNEDAEGPAVRNALDLRCFVADAEQRAAA